RAIAGGPSRGRGDLIGRSAVAVAVGIVVGELAALVLFASSIDRLLERQATHQAESSPAVTAATAELGRARDARSALDTAVEQARTRRDEALVIARCEFNPSPDCPETHITGVPGDGPETQTADDLLAGAQGE